jgi:hypothetical protein
MDGWLELLNTVGATFWSGFPYDIAFLFVLVISDKLAPEYRRVLMVVAVFMALLIAVNLTIGTVPAWKTFTTY